MATYKVIQDIEAEDKLLGPLTLKQFLFACTAAGIGFVGFMVARVTSFYVFFAFLPLMAPFVILAAPLGRDQPTDVWLAAQIRFFLKPRKRIWDQSGLKELVTITAPKKIEHIYTNGLSQTEVHSRLRALADTIDSRGWAVKNVNVNLYSNPALATATAGTDRLLGAESMPQYVQETNVSAVDDMLDPTANPTAQHFDALVRESTQAQHQAAMATIAQARSQNSTQSATKPDDFYFMQSDAAQTPVVDPGAVMFDPQVVAPRAQQTPATFLDDKSDDPPSTDELTALETIKKAHASEVQRPANPHHKSIKTPAQLAAEQRQQQQAAAEAARAKMELSQSNDVSVETIARLAKHKSEKAKHAGNDEVVITLR